MEDAVILGAVRTPIGTFGGGLVDVPLRKLGASVIAEVLKRAKVSPQEIDEVLMGNAIGAGQGQNIARQAAIDSGLPASVPSTTINKVCGSGLKTVALAAQAIRLGDAQVIVAGGMESMSQAPYLLPKARYGYRMGHGQLIDSMIFDGLWCAMADCHMGITAENIVTKYEIPRSAMDQFAAGSQAKAAAAWEKGVFKDEVLSVSIPQSKGDPKIVDRDEHIRPGTTSDALAKLRPAFKPDGQVTAGNSSGINDGAAAVVVTSAKKAKEAGLKPMAVIRSYTSAGVDPQVMGIGPVPAIRAAVKKAGLNLADIDLLELNEAFAAQSVAVLKLLELDPNRVNVNGGAIALGHPIGASGTRILVTLLYEMQRRNSRYGLAALCIGGGQGIAMVVERA